MNLNEFLTILRTHPEHELRFVLPDDDEIPLHAHITECGRVDKRFIDCGGVMHTYASCVLQAWVSDDVEHRISPHKLACIIDTASNLFRNEDLPVEIEYEDCVLSQFNVERALISDSDIQFRLREKHTDCLAKELCLPRGQTAFGNAPKTCC